MVVLDSSTQLEGATVNSQKLTLKHLFLLSSSTFFLSLWRETQPLSIIPLPASFPHRAADLPTSNHQCRRVPTSHRWPPSLVPPPTSSPPITSATASPPPTVGLHLSPLASSSHRRPSSLQLLVSSHPHLPPLASSLHPLASLGDARRRRSSTPGGHLLPSNCRCRHIPTSHRGR